MDARDDVYLGNSRPCSMYLKCVYFTISVPARETFVYLCLFFFFQLGLTKISSTRIGNPVSGGRGISGGEAKRLSFASEVR